MQQAPTPTFSQLARELIRQTQLSGKPRLARDYQNALASFEQHSHSTQLTESNFTPIKLKHWIASLQHTRYSKHIYPTYLKRLYKALQQPAPLADPWLNIAIPAKDKLQSRAITIQALKQFFSVQLPESRMRYPLDELSRDVATLIFCLAGINAIDLYALHKDNYQDGILRYNRIKTKDKRSDNAYMEMRVPPIAQALFAKYANKHTNDAHLLNFYQRMSSSESFIANINGGIRLVCKLAGLSKEESYSTYHFRSTWAAIAETTLQAPKELIEFSLNHTRAGGSSYCFSDAWELNERVISVVFVE